MNKLLLTLSFLGSIFFFTSKSSALPDCEVSSNTFHNCFGTYIWTNGKFKGYKYVGQWKKDQMNGQGIMFYPIGDTYIGEYKDSKKHGVGIYKWRSGAKDIGEFKNGKLNGYAIRYNAKGSILKEGIWKDDEFLYSQNKSTLSNSNSKLDKYKSFCEEIGFAQGTEKFEDCVLEAMKKG